MPNFIDPITVNDVAIVSETGALSQLGVTVTSTAAELNLLDTSVAGTAVASKALVLGANKNVDTVVIADSGLKLGTGAGTAVTSTAAELNLLDTAVAGTAVASKVLVLGANKNIDTIAVADGGFKLGSGAGTSVSSTAAELNLLDATDRICRVEVVALAAVDTAGGVFAWTPGAAAIIKGLFLDVTTKATSACTVDCGVAANGTTLNDTLIDGLDINAAAGLFSNHKNPGTNGLADLRCGATQYVTGSVASGASAGIVGNAYIEYILV